jgi:hypothetical protein
LTKFYSGFSLLLKKMAIFLLYSQQPLDEITVSFSGKYCQQEIDLLPLISV